MERTSQEAFDDLHAHAVLELDDVEDGVVNYASERPLAVLVMAFLAGLLLGRLVL